MLIGAVIGKFINIKISKEFIPIFDEASKYQLTENFEFIKVNEKEICSHYGVNRFPTTKVFMAGNHVEGDPGRELKGFLEFVEKLSLDAVQIVKTTEDLNKFKENHGSDIITLTFNNDTESEYFKCIKRLANEKYKQHFYITAIDEKVYDSKTVTSPALIVRIYFYHRLMRIIRFILTSWTHALAKTLIGS
jgi:hypothetical protein